MGFHIKNYMLIYCIRILVYDIFRTDRFINTESRLVVTKAWGGGTANGYRVSFGADKNILNLDCGNGCIIL